MGGLDKFDCSTLYCNGFEYLLLQEIDAKGYVKRTVTISEYGNFVVFLFE